MKSIVSEKEFPTANKFVSLNAANVALMYHGAHQAIIEWQDDVALNGSNNFDDNSEETVFGELHQVASRLINAGPEDIAAGSKIGRASCRERV